MAENALVQSSNIQKFNISSNQQNKAADLTGGVVDFRYYESVLSNNVTASAVITDSGFKAEGDRVNEGVSVLDDLPIRGGERTDIVIEDNYKNQLRFPDGLYVNRVRDGDSGTQKETFSIDFGNWVFDFN